MGFGFVKPNLVTRVTITVCEFVYCFTPIFNIGSHVKVKKESNSILQISRSHYVKSVIYYVSLQG